MSSPQSLEAEEEPKAEGDPPTEDEKQLKNDDAATNSSSGRDSPPPAATATSTTEVVAPAATRSEPASFTYDPKKITLKFIFANRDGVNAIVEYSPTDTIAEVKGALLSMWPEGEIVFFCDFMCSLSLYLYHRLLNLFVINVIVIAKNTLLQLINCTDLPQCSGGDKIRLICMGKGILSPDSKTLESFDVPVFKTHPTPVNVAVRPENIDLAGGGKKKGSPKKNNSRSSGGGATNADGVGGTGEIQPGSSGCSCIIM